MLFKLAFRNVMRQRRRSLLTLLSMGGGYLLLCLSLSLSEGSYNNIIDLFTRDHTGHIQIHVAGYLDRPALHKRMQQVDDWLPPMLLRYHIKAAAPRLYSPALAYGENKSAPASVIGIDPGREARTTLLAKKVQQGVWLPNQVNEAGYWPAMLGFAMAQTLKLSVGDELVLISQGADGSIANDIFQVCAIVGTEDSSERMNVYLPLTAMRDFISLPQGIHELALLVERPADARDAAQRIQEHLAHRVPQQPLAVKPWQEVEQGFYNGMQADKQGTYISMGIIMFIVSIGVLNTVLMSTLERTREFGVLKAIGTRPGLLFRLIQLEAMLLAVLGCVLGVVLALPVNAYFVHHGIQLSQGFDMGGIRFDRLLGEFSWFTMGVPALVVMGSTLLVSVFPAWRVARITPINALQAV